MRRAALGLILIALAACHRPPIARDAGDGSIAPGDGAPELDAPADGAGRYTQGIYLCCAKGEERTCCPPDTLPDPSVGRIATCFQYGGVRGDCTPEGQQLEAKDICSLCCPGLVRISGCNAVPHPSVFTCAVCGDGVCGPGEATCNCPADCP